MPINPDADLNQITDWLNEQLTDKNRIKACCQEVKNVPAIKGIYFWFMNHSCYKTLSECIEINSLQTHYQRIINDQIYHLVYLGTAGVRNNSNGENNGHLNQRIKWHLCDNKGVSSLCSGTMSTLRRTIGALISDDLIENNTQNKIDELFCESFFIYYAKYTGTFIDIKDIVNSDESILIKVLTPIFNIDENINAFDKNHLTFGIKERRNLVERSSKEKWCYNGKQTMESKRAIRLNPPSNDNLELKNSDGCIEFNVKKHQSIATQIQGIKNLPEGKCLILCYNSQDLNQIIYSKKNGNGWRQTGSGKQNIYTYFLNVDTQYNNQQRWQIIQNEMNGKNIEEITVKICKEQKVTNSNDDLIIANGIQSDNNYSQNNLCHGSEEWDIIPKEYYNTNQSTTHKKSDNSEFPKQERLVLKGNYKIVMMCSSKKNGQYLFKNSVRFAAVTNRQKNEFKPDDLKQGTQITWRQYIKDNQNSDDIELKMAYLLYSNETYQNLYRKFGKSLYIISAGWGLINSEFKLPKYDITFSKGPNIPANTKRIGLGNYYDWNFLKVEQDEEIIFIGALDYLQLFYALTQDLTNHKIIYYYGSGSQLKKNIPPNETFTFRHYPSKNNRRWFYDLANDIINEILP